MPLNLPPSTQILPSEDAIFCQMYEQTGKIPGSRLVMPETAKEEIFVARVHAVGPGRTIDADVDGSRQRLKPFVRPGDTILFARYHGERIQLGDALYIVLRQDDVLATVQANEAELGQFVRPAVIGSVTELNLATAKVSG